MPFILSNRIESSAVYFTPASSFADLELLCLIVSTLTDGNFEVGFF